MPATKPFPLSFEAMPADGALRISQFGTFCLGAVFACSVAASPALAPSLGILACICVLIALASWLSEPVGYVIESEDLVYRNRLRSVRRPLRAYTCARHTQTDSPAERVRRFWGGPGVGLRLRPSSLGSVGVLSQTDGCSVEVAARNLTVAVRLVGRDRRDLIVSPRDAEGFIRAFGEACRAPDRDDAG